MVEKCQPDGLLQPFHFKGGPVDECVPCLEGLGNPAGFSKRLGIQGMAFRQFRITVVQDKGTAQGVLNIFMRQGKDCMVCKGVRTYYGCDRKMSKLFCVKNGQI